MSSTKTVTETTPVVSDLNPAFVRWINAAVGRGNGNSHRKIGVCLVPLPVDNSPETFAEYVAWLGGPAVILKYMDGNSIRVKCQAKGRTLIEAGKSATDENAKAVILQNLRNPGTRGPSQTGIASLDAARQRAYDAMIDQAASMGLTDDQAEALAIRAAEAVKKA